MWKILNKSGDNIFTLYELFLLRFRQILIHMKACDCAAYYGPFRKDHFDYYEGCLRMVPMECRDK